MLGPKERVMPINCHIDFPVYLNSGVAFGSIGGTMALPFVPRIGESISLNTPGLRVLPPANYFPISRVENVVYDPGSESIPVLLTLEPVTVATVADARALMHFFDEGHNFMVDEFGS